MNYPPFFEKVEKIKLVDPLSNVLGTFEKGLVEFTYLDIVKSAGHSCPTVAGAYLMSLHALKALYGDDVPVRGNIRVEFGESIKEGVTGVIANVMSNITGATSESGFKGLNGMFARHSLLFYEREIEASVRFTRIDTDKSVDIRYDPSSVKADGRMQPLMKKMLSGAINEEEKIEFGRLWQDRVERILLQDVNSVMSIETVN